MTMKTYTGGCHCGAVRFEADIDLEKGTTRCNCSLCTKARAWFVIVKADHVRLLAGADAQADYQWVAPGKPQAYLHYRFCKTCGIRTFAEGDPPQGGKFFAVAISSLTVDSDELVAAPIKYVDGRHDQYDRPPQDNRPL